jgi:hypothetical protein
MDQYHVFSTDDVVNWRDEGEILRASQVPWGRKEGGFMWAPDCAYRDGVYYFYFPHPSGTHWNDTWEIGVATSKSPASDFKVQGYIQGLGGYAMIDPCVLMDTDGQAYIYFGGGGRCAAAKLKSNMTELAGPVEPMKDLQDFHEGTWVFKRNETYYLTYADNYAKSNRMRYAVSTNALGPWTYRGVYMEPTGCDTTHGSVVEYKGHWYQFYHNKVISGRGNLRSICVDEIFFNPDGTIQTLTQTQTGVQTDAGGSQSNRNGDKYQIALASVGNGAIIKEDSAASGGKYAANLNQTNSYVEFARVKGDDKVRRATIGIHYAAKEDSKIKLIVNSIDYSFLNASKTGGGDYNGWTFLTVPFGAGATNRIRLIGGNGEAKIDYLTVDLLE